MSTIRQLGVNAMFRRDQWAVINPQNLLTDAVLNAPGNAWAALRAAPGGAVAGAKGLFHSISNPRESIAAMLRADAAILDWMSDPSMPDFDAVGAAVENYALHHDEREIAGDIGGATGGALFAIGSGGVAAAGFARASALLRGLGMGAGEAVAGTAAATRATTAAAERAAGSLLTDAEMACIHGGCARAGTSPLGAVVRDPALGSGNAYSVAYEARLSPQSYPGKTRGAHFNEANRALLDDMAADPEFAAGMERTIPGLRDELLGPAGGVAWKAPQGWTWHHAAERGLMQLVPKIQHTAAGIWQELFHPGGVGGMSIWGN